MRWINKKTKKKLWKLCTIWNQEQLSFGTSTKVCCENYIVGEKVRSEAIRSENKHEQWQGSKQWLATSYKRDWQGNQQAQVFLGGDGRNDLYCDGNCQQTKTVGSCETRLEKWARIVATSALVNDNQRLRNDLGNREEEIGRRKQDLKWDHQKEDKG